MGTDLPEQFLEGLPDAVLILNADGVAEHVNAEATDWFGSELIGKQVGVPLADFAVVQVPGVERLRSGELRVAESPEFGPGRRAIVIRDVTDREAMKVRLLRQVGELERLVEFLTIMPSPVVRVRRDGEVLWRNEAFVEQFGSSSTLAQALPVNGQQAKLADLLSPPVGQRTRSVVFEPDSPDGTPFIAHAVLLQGLEVGGDGSVPAPDQELGIVLNMYGAQERLLNEYLELLHFDPVLHLPNLRGLQLELRPIWDNPAFMHAVIVLVDWSVLDAHGGTLDEFSQSRSRHLADQLSLLRAGLIREFDLSSLLVARDTSNSFAIVLSVPSEVFETLELASVALIDRLHDLGGQSTLSAGVVGSGQVDGPFDEHLQAATVAAEVAHETGAALRTFTDTDAQHLIDEHDMLRRVRKAIHDRAFTVVFQPRIATDDHRLVAVEVLARLHDEDLGDIPPAVFIPLLKRLRLMSELTSIVFDKSLAELTNWRDRGVLPPKLSLNVVSGDLTSPEFLQTLQRVALQVGQRGALELELAETDAFPSYLGPELHAVLDSLGIELSLDDFGTGYSTFGYLVSLPIACIKIDKMFVDQLLIDEKRSATASLIRSIVAMARELRITVCAEGAETAEQVQELTLLGVNEIQGFFFSRPITALELESRYLT
jgi:EAL domain-containing protein (putative c-di-GMP-specific phosphodiesterase class I)